METQEAANRKEDVSDGIFNDAECLILTIAAFDFITCGEVQSNREILKNKLNLKKKKNFCWTVPTRKLWGGKRRVSILPAEARVFRKCAVRSRSGTNQP